MHKRISVIEDDPLIKESVLFFIKKDLQLELISDSSSVEEFMKLRFEIPPSILLLDIGLPGISGVDAIPSIKQKFPEVEIIMLTTYEDEDYIFKALSLGAGSYISKRTSLPKIIEAIHIVALGGSYMSPAIAKKVTAFFNSKQQAKKTVLTNRQTEIVELVVKGFSYQEVANKCFISINTVRSHIRQIYEVLQINGKADLIREYLSNNI